MSCYLENRSTDTFAVLQFEREQLLYDIANNCYIDGHIMPGDTETHVRHTVQDVCEEGNADRIMRVISLAVAHCRELMYPYTKHNIHDKALDDKLKKPGVYGILLRVPESFSQTTLSLFEELIHEYIVCTAVADWLSITDPDKADAWKKKANDAEREISTNQMARMGKTRRRMQPF